MRILLINQNPIISKLAGLSAQKSGFEIVEELSLDTVESGSYDVLFIDDAKLEGTTPDMLKRRTGVKKMCLIYGDDEDKVPGFDYYIKKPFLPTEMVDLMNEIDDDLLLPEVEETETETPPIQEAQEEHSETMEEVAESVAAVSAVENEPKTEKTEEAEEVLKAEDFDALLDELEAESHEEEKRTESEEATEDFDALMASLELEEPAESEAEEPKAVEPAPEALEELSKEPERTESEPERKTVETAETTLAEEEDFEALLEALDLGETTSEEEKAEEESAVDIAEEETEPISLPEPEEPGGGILDEELVSEVKDLLEEEGVEERETAVPAAETAEEEILAEETVEMEEEPVEMTETVAEEAEKEIESAEETGSLEELEELESLEEIEGEDEFDLLSEAELGTVLGEEIAEEIAAESVEAREEPAFEERVTESAAEAASAEEPSHSAQEGVLISKLLGTDPEALRKLLAGAQITINITFPKDV